MEEFFENAQQKREQLAAQRQRDKLSLAARAEEREKRRKESEVKRLKMEAELRASGYTGERPKGRPSFRLVSMKKKELWFKLAAQAKEIAKVGRREKTADNVLLMMKKNVEKRKAEEKVVAAKAAEDARWAGEIVTHAESEEEALWALEIKELAERDEAEAHNNIREMDRELAEATSRFEEDLQKQDEFEAAVFDQKQIRAVLRAEMAKLEQKRERRHKRSLSDHGALVKRASCEFNVTESAVFKKRTLSVDQKAEINEKLKSVERADIPEPPSQTQEARRERRKARVTEKAESRKQQFDARRNKSDAERAATREAIVKNAPPRSPRKETAVQKMNKWLREHNIFFHTEAEKALWCRMMGAGWTVDMLNGASPGDPECDLETFEEAFRLIATAGNMEDFSMIKRLAKVRDETQFLFHDKNKARREAREGSPVKNCSPTRTPRRRSPRRKCSPTRSMSPQRRPGSPVKVPKKTREIEQLWPRTRDPNEPPSPTKENLEALKVEKGIPVKVETQISQASLQKINQEFASSDKLRQEAMQNMETIDATMEEAWALTGGAKRCNNNNKDGGEQEEHDEDVLPAYMNRWYSQNAFAPPIHLHGEKQEIIQLQNNVAECKKTVLELFARFEPQALNTVAKL